MEKGRSHYHKSFAHAAKSVKDTQLRAKVFGYENPGESANKGDKASAHRVPWHILSTDDKGKHEYDLTELLDKLHNRTRGLKDGKELYTQSKSSREAHMKYRKPKYQNFHLCPRITHGGRNGGGWANLIHMCNEVRFHPCEETMSLKTLPLRNGLFLSATGDPSSDKYILVCGCPDALSGPFSDACCDFATTRNQYTDQIELGDALTMLDNTAFATTYPLADVQRLMAEVVGNNHVGGSEVDRLRPQRKAKKCREALRAMKLAKAAKRARPSQTQQSTVRHTPLYITFALVQLK